MWYNYKFCTTLKLISPPLYLIYISVCITNSKLTKTL